VRATCRHESLPAAIDWSYGLLEESDKRLFRRLALIVGGCALYAAEAICHDDAQPDVLAATRAALSEDRFSALWAAGRNAPLEQTIARILTKTYTCALADRQM